MVWIGEVNFVVRNIHIPAKNDRLFLIQCLNVLDKIVQPDQLLLNCLALFSACSCGYISGDKVKIEIFKRDDPAVITAEINSHVQHHGHRFLF